MEVRRSEVDAVLARKHVLAQTLGQLVEETHPFHEVLHKIYLRKVRRLAGSSKATS